MMFSVDGNLFVLFYTDTEEVYYRLKVKEDFYAHERNNDRELDDSTLANDVSHVSFAEV